MKTLRASYSIIQYSVQPDRYEFINIGIVLFNRERMQIDYKISHDFGRLKKFARDINVSFLSLAVEDFLSRLEFEFSRANSEGDLASFVSKQANIFRLTPILPVLGGDLGQEREVLFAELVGESEKVKRIEKVSTKLRNAFKSEGVLQLLDKKPDQIAIARYGVVLKPQFGYQNGSYNLIDAARFDEPESGLAEAGKRALEGKAISESLNNRLVVVGDFGEQSNGFYNAIKEDLHRANTKLFRIDQLGELASDIRSHVSG